MLAGPIGYSQVNLVSDGVVPAVTVDPDLKNPWGISFGPTTPFWISDNGTGLATLYRGDGSKVSTLVVTIPPAPGSPPSTKGTPTGTVFNGESSQFLSDRFLFATEDGTISGWQSSLGSNAAVRVDNSAGGSVYKGLAIDNGRIYATNFRLGTVDVFDSGYAPVLPGSFLDPNLPGGFAPFGIAVHGGAVYVTYAKQDTDQKDDVAGPGNGFVDQFNPDGSLQQRLISGGPLNSPWGLAWAPDGFGPLSGQLLVGNFGDGRINAFDPNTGSFSGALSDQNGNPIVNDGLWGLEFGNGGPGFNPNALYFTAGQNDEADGLFGSLHPVPEPASFALLCAGLIPFFALRLRRRRS